MTATATQCTGFEELAHEAAIALREGKLTLAAAVGMSEEQLLAITLLAKRAWTQGMKEEAYQLWMAVVLCDPTCEPAWRTTADALQADRKHQLAFVCYEFCALLADRTKELTLAQLAAVDALGQPELTTDARKAFADLLA